MVGINRNLYKHLFLPFPVEMCTKCALFCTNILREFLEPGKPGISALFGHAGLKGKSLQFPVCQYSGKSAKFREILRKKCAQIPGISRFCAKKVGKADGQIKKINRRRYNDWIFEALRHVSEKKLIRYWNTPFYGLHWQIWV